MKLPTVTLYDTKKNRKIKINAHVYAMNLHNYAQGGRFKIVGESRGEADSAEIAFQKRQERAEIARTEDPTHAASKDAERTYEARQGRVDVTSEPEDEKPPWVEDDNGAVIGEVGAGLVIVDEPNPVRHVPKAKPKPKKDDWRSMTWFEARSAVKKATGTLPKNKAHAEELMAAKE